MSLVLETASILLLIWTVSQLGRRIPASAAVLWISVSLFIVLATFSPEALVPVAAALNIALVSNLVLAFLVIFVFIVALSLTTALARTQRQLRSFVCENSARSSPIPVDSAKSADMTALILVPCYNEAGEIERTIERLQSFVARGTPGFKVRYLIVDDGSLDSTRKILSSKAKGCYVFHSVNVGVAGVLATGLKIADASNFDYVVQCDADGQHPIEDIGTLLQHAASSKVDLLIGSRFVRESGVRPSNQLESTTFVRWAGGQLIRAVLRLFGKGAGVTDPTSGFRAYSRRTFNMLLRDMPDEYPEPETIALLASRGFKIGECAVEMAPRTSGRSSLAGIASLRFMIKVVSALLGLRLRNMVANFPQENSV